MKLFFISKCANWQKYRLEVLTKLAETYGYDVEILTTGKLKPYLQANHVVKYKIFNSIFPQKFSFSLMPGILKYIIKNKPDVVLCLNNSTQLTEYLALMLCKLIGVRFVWWTHGFDHAVSKKPTILKILKEKYVLFFLNQSDSIITFSDKGRDYLISKGIPAKKIVTALNTMDTDKILKIKNKYVDKKHSIKEQFGFEISDRLLVFTGRLTKEKKIDHAILACQQLQSEFPNLKLIIIGNGSELTYLKKLAEDIDFKNVQFLGEIYDEEILSQWLLISDIYIMPAYVGLGIIHAFCYGLPILTEEDDSHGPCIQYLKDGKNGYMVKRDNIVELSSKVKELLSDETKLDLFSEEAFNTVLNEGSVNSMIYNMHRALI
ncbi:MAG: glycosyltransferase family 4 protein [Paludibacter sp.]|nr:glycosyltransferase family 4 protein [Paludibacter sp.]